MLEQALAPLVGGDAQHPRAAAARARASVRDLGERYRVEVGAVAREFDDSARDCRERARVAAVFIALNRKKAQAAPRPPNPRRSRAEAAAPNRSEAGRRRAGTGARADRPPTPFEGSRRRRALRHAVVRRGRVRAGAEQARARRRRSRVAARRRTSASSSAPARSRRPTSICNAERRERRGRAAARCRRALSASYLLRAGRVSLRARARLRARRAAPARQDLPDPQTALRLNPGGLAALDAHARLGSAWLALLRLSLSAFPRAYDLAVDRPGSWADPRLWLGATLGIRIHNFANAPGPIEGFRRDPQV